MSAKTFQLPANRVLSIDIVRGLVMVIMALDHVRDYFHLGALQSDPTNMQTTTALLFFTRWVTHYCAPTFVFLSGISTYLSGQRKTVAEHRRFLLKRGLWLVFVEVVLVSLALTLDPTYHFIILQVIWAIGLSMILLALLLRLPLRLIAAIGIAIFVGHNLLDYVTQPAPNSPGGVLLTTFVTSRGSVLLLGGGRAVGLFYAVLPWTGIMLLGYSMGAYFKSSYDAAKRKRALLTIGSSLVVVFILLRWSNTYGDPSHWQVQRNGVMTFLSFLNVTKYPCSFLYGCLTLGPSIILLTLTERSRNGLARFATVYGRVPFFYYICHFYLIRVLSIVLFFATGYGVHQIVDPQVPFLFRPATFGFCLGGVYLIWAGIVLALYYPCRWFYRYKQTHTQWWLRYL